MNFFKFLFVFLLIPLVYATCTSDQIDINSASVTQLDKLEGIGPATAQNIINSRPYASLDDLNRAAGIGDAKLANIKNQGLACINNKDSSIESKQENFTSSAPLLVADSTENIINLNSQQIMSNSFQKEKVVFESKNEKMKRNLIFFFAFFLIMIILFLLIEN